MQHPGDRSARLGRSPLTFFVLTFALAIPFVVFGALTGLLLLPGLPVAALMFVCPGMAALILTYREHGTAGAKALLNRALDYKRISPKVWYSPIVLIAPCVAVLSYGIVRLTGTPVPALQIAVLPTLLLCVTFFVAALGEELGWSGYVIDPLQNRWGALKASLFLGSIWAVFHYAALLEAHRSIVWIAWWSLGTVATRVIMVWLYNHAGKSVVGAALFHMTVNLAWQLFPIRGSYFDPRINGLIMAMVAAIVIVVWRPRTSSSLRESK
jgi:membrane protease YdiL (CAAX protease family)